ncbi:MAG: FHA domain-containing protein [Proteobacteria bacterium]|nr:FHA domain-containing protein [Pseudomonadota bacterium]MCL2307518.1 FHA domain-containing protein [Pseudomonadota bacterium]
MIWVEILSRHKELIGRSRHNAENGTLSIGRGYNNDVIVDDACVAPQHVLLRRDDRGLWTVEDRGTQNGMFDSRGLRHTRLVLLNGDTLFRIGHTWLRVRTTDFPVAPERQLLPPQRLWPWLLLLATLAFGISALEIWSNQIGEFRASLYLMPIVSLLMTLVIWISLWAGLSRLLSGAANFARHALIALSGLTAALLLGALFSWGAFAFSARPLVDYNFAMYWLVFGVTCFYHLRAISPRLLRLKAVIIAALCIAAITVQWLVKDPFSPHQGNSANHPYLKDLWPPAMRVIAPQPQDRFFRNLEKIKTDLDELRKKEPEGEGMFDMILEGDD